MKDAKESIKSFLKEKAFTTKKDIVKKYPDVSIKDLDDDYWLFDIKSIIFNPEFITAVAEEFWTIFKDKEILQIGGLETTGIALAEALVIEGAKRGKKVNGFYIRKSRNKHGLQKQIEGEFYKDRETVFVDDLTNSGSSIRKAVLEITEKMVEKSFWYKIHKPTHKLPKSFSVFTILRFRDSSYYANIKKEFHLETFHSVFSLNDLQLTINGNPVRKVSKPDQSNTFQDFIFNWKFKDKATYKFQSRRYKINTPPL